MTARRLPIGIQSFSELVRTGCLYVDKSAQVHRLIHHGKAFFLSRPRRFGKSLLVSTCAALFEGRRELFSGLAIEGLGYDWPVHKVIHLDMSRFGRGSATEVAAEIREHLLLLAEDLGVELPAPASLNAAFSALIRGAAKASVGGQTVVLIDEYDKPLLDQLSAPEAAIEIRELLRSFYGILKAEEQRLRFVLLTGISRFARVSVFSGLNNLNDITSDGRYCDLLGYTESEIDAYFDDHLEALANRLGEHRQQVRDTIKRWYNGYRFTEQDCRVYNPFSVLLLFDKQAFRNYWFESGTPTFLVDLMKRQAHVAPHDLEGMTVGDAAFSSFEVDKPELIPLLVQTGYLTIASSETQGERVFYTLAYPNHEVRISLAEQLLGSYSDSVVRQT